MVRTPIPPRFKKIRIGAPEYDVTVMILRFEQTTRITHKSLPSPLTARFDKEGPRPFLVRTKASRLYAG